jgi:hypothetical protein
LLSKTPFRLGIIIPLEIMVVAIVTGWSTIPRPRLAWWATRALVPAIVMYCLAAWWNPALGPWCRAWQEQLWEARQDTAQTGFTGEVPDHWGSNRAGKGDDYDWLFNNKTQWVQASEQSFYDRMGGWLPAPPDWIFDAAGWLLVAGVAVNLIGLATSGWRVPAPLVVAMALSPLIIGANIVGHAWTSLHVDFQPQGRYLFPCLIPIYFLWAGAIPVERRWIRWPHLIGFFSLAIGLSIYQLWKWGVLNPLLNHQIPRP